MACSFGLRKKEQLANGLQIGSVHDRRVVKSAIFRRALG